MAGALKGPMDIVSVMAWKPHPVNPQTSIALGMFTYEEIQRVVILIREIVRNVPQCLQ